jgi:citrate synthase
MKHFFDGFPSTAHPMAVLSSMVCSLSTYYPEEHDLNDKEKLDVTIARLISKVRTIAAYAYKKSIGQPFIYPRNDLKYVGNFLNMMFAVPSEPYTVDPEIEAAMNLLFILHADHEQNCSTSTVRLVGSSRANLFASIAAGILALWGPLHGGANQEVIEMLEQIKADGGNVKKYVELAKDKNSNFRLMGFGHRVYKNFDPRAKIIKQTADKILKKLGINDPLLDIAKGLEEAALKDSYFVERKLYPNVDFYSGIIYRALGFPTNMFTVLFAIGRLPGWIAHWKEMMEDTTTKIGRPRQIYTGPTERAYVAIDQRGK